MANTYELIKGETLASSATSYTFSAIPSTYTDLLIKVSLRCSDATVNNQVAVSINGLTANYSETWLYGNGTSKGSSLFNTGVGLPYWNFGGSFSSGSSGTSNTFNNAEIYFPNYAGSQRKTGSTFGVQEENAAGNNYIFVDALNNTTTSAITSVKLEGGGSWVAGSSFYLYGIKNS